MRRRLQQDRRRQPTSDRRRQQQQAPPLLPWQDFAMLAATVTLLIASVFIAPSASKTASGGSIQCYECRDAVNNSLCSRPQDLTDCERVHAKSFDACLTTVFYKAGEGMKINKRCTLRPCQLDDPSQVAHVEMFSSCSEDPGAADRWQCSECCTGNGCNANGATTSAAATPSIVLLLLLLYSAARSAS